ncbi:MAG TPA: ribosome-associated translation inhibitor RaiA [Candidatus Atribacteria bacterium]|nr:ribosome-associated translation inhibitor RaiA [Candidatus Atribacteria bacterium]
MEINYKGRHVNISEDVKSYFEKKLVPIERHLKTIDSINVVISYVKGTTIIEVTLNAKGLIIRAQEEDQEWRNAVDRVVEKLESQIRKYKGKLYDRIRKSYDIEVPQEEEEPEEEVVKIDKVKEFPMKPMSPEEAILQMELLGHSFFVFRDAETDSINVVYKRKSGGYGLIITS